MKQANILKYLWKLSMQNRSHFNAMFCVTLIIASGSGPVLGQELITIPGYRPDQGSQRVYEVERRTENDELAWGSPRQTVELGEFQQTASVVSTDDHSIRTRWMSSNRIPVEAYSNAPPHTVVVTHPDTLDGTPVEIQTDLAGLPAALLEPDQLREYLQQKIPTASAMPQKQMLFRLLAELDGDAITVTDDLVPGISLLARRQAAETVTAKLGDTWKISREADVEGNPLPVVTSGVWESVDHSNQTAVVNWSEAVDSDELTKAIQAKIEQIIALQQAKWNLTNEQLAPLKRATLRSFGRATISLRDGSTIEATEVVVREAAGIRTTMRTHIRQVDAAIGSSHYESRLRQAQLEQTERESDLQSALAHSRATMEKMKKARQVPEIASLEGLLGGSSATPTVEKKPKVSEQLPENVKYSEPVALQIESTSIVNAGGSAGLKFLLTPDSAITLGDFTMRMISRTIQVKVAGKVAFSFYLGEPIIRGEFDLFGDRDYLDATSREAPAGTIIELRAIPEKLPVEIESAAVTNSPSEGLALDLTLTPASASLYEEFTRAGKGRTVEFSTGFLQTIGSMVVDQENDTGKIQLHDLPDSEENLQRLAESLPGGSISVAIKPD